MPEDPTQGGLDPPGKRQKTSNFMRLIIRHPTMPAKEITARLGLRPTRSRSAGMPRRDRRRRIISRSARETVWSHRRPFTSDKAWPMVERLIAKLEPAAPFLRAVTAEGGRCSLSMDLRGDRSARVGLSPDLMRRMADMSLQFGFEVYAMHDPVPIEGT